MLEKAKSCGMVVYKTMLKPIPVVCQRAIFSFWISTIVTGIIELAFSAVRNHIRKSA